MSFAESGKMYLGIRYSSAWLITLAVYYLLLTGMRYFLLHGVRPSDIGKNLTEELRKYRLCGVLLLFMNIILSSMIVLIMNSEGTFEYKGNLIYVMAGYTFYLVINAVRNVIKYRKIGSPLLSASKVIAFACALISTLSLETAMMGRFGAADDPVYQHTIICYIGAVIAVIYTITSMYMIISSTIKLKNIICKK